jgi:hypothetical protein
LSIVFLSANTQLFFADNNAKKTIDFEPEKVRIVPVRVKNKDFL